MDDDVEDDEDVDEGMDDWIEMNKGHDEMEIKLQFWPYFLLFFRLNK